MATVCNKKAGETTRVSIDWSDTGVVTLSAWSLPDGFTLLISDHDGSETTAAITGGVEGEIYQLTNTATVDGVPNMQRDVILRVTG